MEKLKEKKTRRTSRIIAFHILEYLDMTRDLFTRAFLARFDFDIHGNELVPSTGLAVDDKFATTKLGNNMKSCVERIKSSAAVWRNKTKIEARNNKRKREKGNSKR